MDVHQIWHRGRWRNHLWQIFWWSVKGCRFCMGSKIAISHWLSQSQLTLGWRYHAARDSLNSTVLLLTKVAPNSLYLKYNNNTAKIQHTSPWLNVQFIVLVRTSTKIKNKRWSNGSMDQDATWYGSRPLSKRHCDRWGHSSPFPKRGRAPQFSVHVYCGQTAGWIKMPLGKEAGLGPGPLPKNGAQPPNFWPMPVVPKRLDGSRCHLLSK